MCKDVKFGDNPEVDEVANIGDYRNDVNEDRICYNP